MTFWEIVAAVIVANIITPVVCHIASDILGKMSKKINEWKKEERPNHD